MKLQKTLVVFFLFVITSCNPNTSTVPFTPEATSVPVVMKTETSTPLATTTLLPTATLSPEKLIAKTAITTMSENQLPADFSNLPREQGVAIISELNKLKAEKGGEKNLVYIAQNKETMDIEYYDEISGEFVTVPGSSNLLNNNGVFIRTKISNLEELKAASTDGSLQMPTGDRTTALESIMSAPDYKTTMIPGVLLRGKFTVEVSESSGSKTFFSFLTFRYDANNKPIVGIIIKVTESNPINIFVGGSDQKSRAVGVTFAEVDRPKDGIVRNGLYWLAIIEYNDERKNNLNKLFEKIENDIPQTDVINALFGHNKNFGPATLETIYIAENIIVYQPN